MDDTKKEKNKVNKIKTFHVPFSLTNFKENFTINTNTPLKSSKEEIINQALNYHSQGNIKKARKYYHYLINQGLQDHKIFSNYGVLLKHLGNADEAAIYIRKATELKPDLPNLHFNLGIILKDLGRLQEAELSTRKAIELNPNFTNAHTNLGEILSKIGKLKEAELSTRKAIELNPNYALAHSNLGNVLREQGKLQEAELSTRKAIRLNPNCAIAHSNLGNILSDLDQLKEAELSTRKSIALNPNYADAYLILGNILNFLGKLREAELSIRKAIELNPNNAIAHSNLGKILSDLNKLQEAEISYRKAIALNPNYADAYFNLSTIELLKGNYKSGLENYEFRFKGKKRIIPHGKTNIKKVNQQKIKTGEKLLVISEQGLGDTLQYMRYIPYLRIQGLDVSFSAQEKLHSLIKSSGIDHNPLTPSEANSVSEGKWIPLLSVPRYLQISPKNPIISEPYIYSTAELNKKWKDIFSKARRPLIGINWQGNKEIEKRTYQGRSIPLENFSILANNYEITMISLQKGFGSEQLKNCSFKNKFIECQPRIDLTWDFLENAAIIENCDLIITCDTSIAHLAGGMGKKVWLLLKDIPFWTWGLEGESTFWYPSMKLFRQKERHNWNEVMKQLSRALEEEMTSRQIINRK